MSTGWKIALSVLLAAVVLLTWRGCRETNYKNLPPTATGPWVAFGDSLTAGLGATEGQGYPAKLSELTGIKVENHGVAGHTTADGLNRLPEVLEVQPRVVLLCFGGNDTLQSLPMDQTFLNLEKMIDAFHAEGSFVVLLAVRSASLRDKFSSRFKELAKRKEVLLVPNILDGLLANPKLMSDQIHPNDAGYEQVAAKVARSLSPYMERLTAPRSPR